MYLFTQLKRRQRVRYVTSSRGCDYRDCVTPFLEGALDVNSLAFPQARDRRNRTFRIEQAMIRLRGRG